MIENTNPFFSVITCTYNRQELLCRAIKSVINQAETDWELIIIDDGSTDDTFNIVEDYYKFNSNIKYKFHENIGAAKSKNTGMKTAIGKYITFLDSDDEYYVEHLKNIKEYLSINPEIEFLYGLPTIVGNQYVPDKNNPEIPVHLYECVIGGTFFIKREILYKLGYYPNVKYGEDAVLFETAIKNNCKISKINMPTYIYYRNNIDSLCNQLMEKKSD